MLRVCMTALASLVFTGVIGYFLLPVLRALKAGQSIREIGPTWHNSKAGTPMMGGLMFIISAMLCLALSLPFVEEKTAFYVLGLGLCFGLVGFLDDFFKLKFKRNLGLTALQKAMLQMAVSALYLYLLYLEGSMTSDLYIPFLNKTVHKTVTVRLENSGGSSLTLIVPGKILFLSSAVVENVGNRFAYMGPQPQQIGMVRQDQHTEILAGSFQSALDGSDDAAVQIFNGLDLLFRETLMGHFVGGFQMDIGKITAVL